MLTAIATAHWTKGFFNQDGGDEFPLLMAATALAVAFTGPGRYSLDRLFDWTLAGDEWGIAALAVGVASFWPVARRTGTGARRMHHHHHLPA
jgi:putative oxidoreductase